MFGLKSMPRLLTENRNNWSELLGSVGLSLKSGQFQ